MADTSDVEAAVVVMLGQAVYPVGQFSNLQAAAQVNIQRGWPTEAEIRTAVANNMILVRVHAVIGLSRDTTRYPRDWVDQTQSTPTLIATVSGDSITFSGVPALGQFVGVTSPDYATTYVVAADDTLVTVVEGLAGEIVGATAFGNILNLPASVYPPQVVVTQSGTSVAEAGRADQLFCIAVWAPSPALRDAIMQLIFPAVDYNYRLALADGTTAVLMGCQATGPDDVPGRAGEWRRDLRVSYDFAVTYAQQFPPVTVSLSSLAIDGDTPIIEPGVIP
jgi:hypothetical protein